MIREIRWWLKESIGGRIFFTLVFLGAAARLAGFRILRVLAYIKEEILTCLAVSTSEVALPPLMKKPEQLGCTRSVVGLVTPTGYSFNQDGGAVEGLGIVG